MTLFASIRGGGVLARKGLRVIATSEQILAAPPDVVVGVALRNQSTLLRRCLLSVVAQDVGHRRVAVVILDDGSTDNWDVTNADLLNQLALVRLQANCGSAARSRNAILDYVDTHLPSALWVARLDADDCFTTSRSLGAAIEAGERHDAMFVLGGNRLFRDGRLTAQTNNATSELLDAQFVVKRLEQMAEGTAENELPSCNLLLRTRSGVRYPDVRSAEDHWLVARLLLQHPRIGTVMCEPYYCDYSLSGEVTQYALSDGEYGKSRRKLAVAARCWVHTSSQKLLLGAGQEGVVYRVGDQVEKIFYEGTLTVPTVDWLQHALGAGQKVAPTPEWHQDGKSWRCTYPWDPSEEAARITTQQALDFLRACLDAGIVCANIKRTNFRIVNSRLVYIDIGTSILPMNVDVFMDSAARLYAISALNLADDELARRDRGSDVLANPAELPGFQDFYADLVRGWANSNWEAAWVPSAPELVQAEPAVTLMIKACAMDAGIVADQVRHIVRQLSLPRSFAEVVLAVDPFRGPFLRQYSPGDYPRLMREAEALLESRVVNRIVIAPEASEAIAEINERWFGIGCVHSHSNVTVPVAPQLWAFEQIGTRYVLQCDVDVIIGRRDLRHDYLSEMLQAVKADDVLGVAFNIAHEPVSSASTYAAPPGEYVPEVRCGLLDLARLKECRPLPNYEQDGRLALSWYRSVQKCQALQGKRTLRGGDPRTFYIHPPNSWKTKTSALERVRDLAGQGRVPVVQHGRWDLEGTPEDWEYARRVEPIVVLAKGRNTPPDSVRRFAASMLMQDDQAFGLIVIDDASDDSTLLPHVLKPLESRLTLMRNSRPHGRIPNFITGVSSICIDPETLVVIVDMDDALISPRAISRLRAAQGDGHDLILGAMFRPDKPLKLYHPNFVDPRRKWGGEVWIHLRAFQKRLFDRVPREAFQVGGKWIEECTDYATMIPMVELARKPLYLPEYLYYHQRTTPRTPEVRARKDDVIRSILAKPPMTRPNEDVRSQHCITEPMLPASSPP
ncbi:MAG: glycosyltransferase family 2 protein [Planctomycetes bacterium]|nr:glycosyltransferase family 2 protein [Planctomycetota bacterium]